ncbi:hypothetical protein [uncultured Dialister sp.]|uniref:hypothetical protein n=1 Tax=uncultured Dialister sp. TaxID=278064 RepID=UPI0025998A40|nr:hypothetical protein [uncultured Dialister sp.]
MSILKGILHYWNKTNSAYDTIHPETEVAQITDWHSGIIASLASKTLGTVVDAITTDSVLGKLMKMLLNASGVKYNIADNGYVCLGSFFGGLIIQWGRISFSGSNTSQVFSYTVSMTSPTMIWVFDYGDKCEQVSGNLNTSNTFIAYRESSGTANYHFCAIGML